jgi:hypothetical protein
MMTSDQIEGSPALNLDALERKVWMRYFEDGINDLYLGMLLLLMGAGLFAPEKDTLPTNHILLLATIGLLVCAGYFLAKRFITYPRIGMVKFGPRAKVRQKRATVLLSLSALVGLALFVIFMLSASGGLGITAPDILYPVAWSVNCLLVFGLTGYFWGQNRLYLIAVLYALPLPLLIGFRQILGANIGFLAFAVPATPIVVIGAVLLIRFIRNYPLPHEMSNVRSSR